MNNYFKMESYFKKRRILYSFQNMLTEFDFKDFSVSLLNEKGYLNALKCTNMVNVTAKRAIIVLAVHYKNKHVMNLELYEEDGSNDKLNLFISLKKEYMSYLELKKLQLGLLIGKFKKTNPLFSYQKRKEYKQNAKQKELLLKNEFSLLRKLINDSISFLMTYVEEDKKSINFINSNLNNFKRFINESKEIDMGYINKGIYSKALELFIDLFDEESLLVNSLNEVYSNKLAIDSNAITYLEYNSENNYGYGYLKLDNLIFLNELQLALKKVRTLDRDFSDTNLIYYEEFISLIDENRHFVFNNLNLKHINKNTLNFINQEISLTRDVSQDLFELFLTENKLEKNIISFFELSRNNHYFYTKNIYSLKKSIKRIFREKGFTELLFNFNENDELILSFIDKIFQFEIELFRINFKNKKIYNLESSFYSNNNMTENILLLSNIKLLKDLFKESLPSFEIEKNKKIKFHYLIKDEYYEFLNINN